MPTIETWLRRSPAQLLTPEDDFAAAEFALGTLSPGERAAPAARRLREPDLDNAIHPEFTIGAPVTVSPVSDTEFAGQPGELHPSGETLDLSDSGLVVSYQTVSVWRSSASNSTGGL